MSSWEERRRKSWGYYVCLLLVLWPVLLMPLGLISSIPFLSIEALGLALMSSFLMVGLFLGCGARYNFRGINPSSRNVINSTDDQYFQSTDLSRTDTS